MEQPAQIPTTFTFQNHTIWTVQKKNGSIWFVNSDICQVLGIANSREALDYLYPEEKNVVEGKGSTTPVNSFYPLLVLSLLKQLSNILSIKKENDENSNGHEI